MGYFSENMVKEKLKYLLLLPFMILVLVCKEEATIQGESNTA